MKESNGMPASHNGNCRDGGIEELQRRRIHAYHFEVEKMIYSTIINIERTDSHDKLTDAIIKLRGALNDVSDYYDEKIKSMFNGI